MEIPTGAIENGREHLRRLREHYEFECEAGSLENCIDYSSAVHCFEVMAVSIRRQADRIERLEGLLSRAVEGPWLEGDLERARALLKDTSVNGGDDGDK